MAFLYYAKNWETAPWLEALRAAAPEFDIRTWPHIGRSEEIDYALVWHPPAELFDGLTGLKAVFSLGAGVDHLLGMAGLPENLPLFRVIDPDLTARMTEYVVLHVLMHHRRQRLYDQLQRQHRWQSLPQPAASQVQVGVMGLGVLGRDAACKLRMLGFQVAGWSREPRDLEGIACFSGTHGLAPFLARSEILVCLLPVTEQTRGILNYPLFERLKRSETGPVLINAGRGALQREEDILAALADGTLKAATLDTFEQEPLPPESPLWSHPDVTVTPHNAAVSDPGAIAACVIGQIRRFEAGQPMENRVERQRGY